ncbi:hypothetical protein ACHAWF_003119 [Thalassiosira exigua]
MQSPLPLPLPARLPRSIAIPAGHKKTISRLHHLVVVASSIFSRHLKKLPFRPQKKSMSHLRLGATALRRSRRVPSTSPAPTAATPTLRPLSSTADAGPPSSSPDAVLDEPSLLSRLAPLKRVVCLCPVPLGRGRVSWSGGDDDGSDGSHDDRAPPDAETVDLSFRSRPRDARKVTQFQPLRVARYRYGERFAIGCAVSDPYLTHAVPVNLGGPGGGKALRRGFRAEIVPTFRCDGERAVSELICNVPSSERAHKESSCTCTPAHGLGSTPIFHTNLPYFRNDFLQHIGHFDVGAVVLAPPMKPARNPFCPTPTRVQLEQERKMAEVRECLLAVLRNYVSADGEEREEEEAAISGNGDVRGDGRGDVTVGRHIPGPMNLRGRVDRRLGVADVLSKASDARGGNWDHLAKSLRRIQDGHTLGRTGGGRDGYYLGNREYGSHNVYSSVPPELHAAVALNAMMDEHTGGYHNSFF